MTGLLVVAAFVALALLAPRYGVDSRDGSDWRVRWGRFGWSGRSDRDRPVARYRVGTDLRRLIGLFRRVGRYLARRWAAQERAWGACWSAHQPWRGADGPRADGPRADEPEQRGELRWRQVDGDWRLTGQLMPPTPPKDRPSSEPSASNG